MKEKEKVLAEIEAKLSEFDAKIEQLSQRAERDNDSFTPRHHSALEKMKSDRALVEARLKDLKTADETTWSQVRSELEGYMRDIDDNFRDSLSYLIL